MEKNVAGWLVGVFIEFEGAHERRYFLVGKPDQGRAEWAAVDSAMLEGPVAASPVRGQEPVEAVRALPPHTLAREGVAAGVVKPLGPRLPRRLHGPS